MQARPPRLVAFYHVVKTGGTSTREWLLRNAGLRSRGLPVRVHGFVRYYEAHCFYCLQLARSLQSPSAGCNEKLVGRCRAEPRSRRPAAFDIRDGDWRKAGTLAVEFHGLSGDLFAEDVLPHAHELRRLYARSNGTCTFATVVRDPVKKITARAAQSCCRQ